MRTKDLIAELTAAGPQDLSVILHFFADRAHAARLADGQGLRDCLDFSAWLRELAEASKVVDPIGQLLSANPSTRIQPSPAVMQDWCNSCGHEAHPGRECGVAIGGERICRCE